MEYELIIIGGGAAAFAAAVRADQLKKKTLMINDNSMLPIGGTCVNVGCIPSKIMLHQGRLSWDALKTGFRALSFTGSADLIEALHETREMVKLMQKKNYLNVIETMQSVDYMDGHAVFLDPHRIRVGSQEFTGRFLLIATGASTFIPPVKGIDSVEYLTNRTVFDTKQRPQSMTILGGGSEAMEFSQIFHRFGVKVTVIQRSERVLTKFDAMIAEKLQEALTDEGITIYTGTTLKDVEKTDRGILVRFASKDKKEMAVEAEVLLIATGLKGNTHNLGIEYSGVNIDSSGFVEVNEFLQTNQPHIYAAGDVTGTMPLETVAAKQGRIAVENIFEGAGKKINYRDVPRAVFTDPEVASVGITEHEYMKEHGMCLCRTISFEHVEKAQVMKATGGIIRMVVEPETKVVAGVQIVGPMAADIITTATYAIRNRMTIYDIRDTVHVFPTLSEAIKKVAQSFDQDIEKMPCCVE